MPKKINTSNGHQRRPSRRDVRRFLGMTRTDGNGGCWIWTGHCDSNGYGQFKYEGKAWWAHRFAYLAFLGSLQEGLEVDHLCHTHNCVNPHHLKQNGVTVNRKRQRRSK